MGFSPRECALQGKRFPQRLSKPNRDEAGLYGAASKDYAVAGDVRMTKDRTSVNVDLLEKLLYLHAHLRCVTQLLLDELMTADRQNAICIDRSGSEATTNECPP